MAVLEAMRQPTAVSALKMLSSRSRQSTALTCPVRKVPVASSAKRRYVSITYTRVRAADVPTMADVPKRASTVAGKGLNTDTVRTEQKTGQYGAPTGFVDGRTSM